MSDPHATPYRAAELERWTRWIFDTCLFWGCQPETAAHVAGHFAEGLRMEWSK